MNKSYVSNQHQHNITSFPYIFSINTFLHDKLIHHNCPPAARNLFEFTSRLGKPGTIIEFSKKDFDNYRIELEKKPYSVKWFKYCLKKLQESRIFKIIKNYGHYTYKAIIDYPWKVDNWLIDINHPQYIGDRSENYGDRSENYGDRSENYGDRSENYGDRSNQINRNEYPKKWDENPKKDPSKADSSVPLNRYQYIKIQDKQSGKDDERVTDSQYYKSSTGYNRTKVIQKLNDSCFAPQNGKNLAKPNKDPLSKPKPERRSLSHLLKLKPLKQGLNVDLKQQQEELIDEEKVTGACNTKVTESLQDSDTTVAQDISPVDNTSDTTPEVKKTVQKTDKDKPNTRIVNKDWRKHLEELDDLGVLENSTVRKAVQSNSMTTVKNAIALYREKKRHSHIHNPCGYFIQALKEKWGSKQSAPPINDSDSPEDKLTRFRVWYDLGKELGHCTKYEQRDGEFWVLKSGSWERFTDLWNQGYTLEYFRKEFKKYTKP